MCGGEEGSARDLLRQALDRAFLDRGMTRAQIARILGVSKSYLSDIPGGRRPLSATIAARLARVGIDGRPIWLAQAAEEFCDAEEREASAQRLDAA